MGQNYFPAFQRFFRFVNTFYKQEGFHKTFMRLCNYIFQSQKNFSYEADFLWKYSKFIVDSKNAIENQQKDFLF